MTDTSASPNIMVDKPETKIVEDVDNKHSQPKKHKKHKSHHKKHKSKKSGHHHSKESVGDTSPQENTQQPQMSAEPQVMSEPINIQSISVRNSRNSLGSKNILRELGSRSLVELNKDSNNTSFNNIETINSNQGLEQRISSSSLQKNGILTSGFHELESDENITPKTSDEALNPETAVTHDAETKDDEVVEQEEDNAEPAGEYLEHENEMEIEGEPEEFQDEELVSGGPEKNQDEEHNEVSSNEENGNDTRDIGLNNEAEYSNKPMEEMKEEAENIEFDTRDVPLSETDIEREVIKCQLAKCRILKMWDEEDFLCCDHIFTWKKEHPTAKVEEALEFFCNRKINYNPCNIIDYLIYRPKISIC
jgi:hypothetical protein